MSSKALGIPHGERVPQAREISDNLSQDVFWAGYWSGSGTYSNVNVEEENWYTIDKVDALGIDASIVIEMGEPINLTHVSLLCDNSFSPQATESLYVYYSNDGISWVELDREAATLTHFYSTVPSDSLEVYVWIPRTKIKAKFWKLGMPSFTFSSDYGDGKWHVSRVLVGTLDYFDDIVFDMNYSGHDDITRYSEGLSEPPNIMPWVSASKYIHTGMLLSFLFIARDDHGIQYKALFLDIPRLEQVKSYGHGSSTYESFKKTVSILTQSGFIIGVGDGSETGWDASFPYVYGSSRYYDKYNAFGFSNDPKNGSYVTRKLDKLSHKHGLPSIPSIILGVTYSVQYAYHPDIPDIMVKCDGSSLEYPIVLNDNEMVLDPAVNEIIASSAGAGYIAVALDSSKLTTGTYTGNGTSSNPVDTGLGTIPRCFMFMRKTGTKQLYFSVYENTVHTAYNGVNQGTHLDLEGDIYTIIVSDTYINELGIEYVWWAFA